MFCASGTVCFELLKGIPAAFVALVIGLIAACITWNQYKVARAKLNLDLFDKRHNIFQKTWECLSLIYDSDYEKRRIDLMNYLPEASFIFGKEVEVYLRNINEKLIQFNILNIKIKNQQHHPVEDSEIKKNAELANWLLNEASTGVKDVFSPYLDFSKWQQFR